MSDHHRSSQSRLYATGHQLKAHLEQLAEAAGEQPDGASRFTLAMGRVLLQRIEHAPRGVEPMGFNLAVVTLVEDCKAGVSSLDGKQMPREVTGEHSMQYSAFEGLVAPQLARDAFGEEYANAYNAVRAQMRHDISSGAFPPQPE